MDQIEDIISNPIEEADQEDRDERIAQMRNKLKMETKNHDSKRTTQNK